VDPEFRRNEVLRLIEDGLQDISISRQRTALGHSVPATNSDGLYVGSTR
jgi:methionyl-tRNA synthetase